MQFKDVEDLKKFLTWAKGQGIAKVEAAGISIEFSPYEFVPGIQELKPEDVKPAKDELGKASETWTDIADPENEDELLFWSAR